VSPPNNSLERTRLACGKLESLLLAKWRENESAVARAAGRLSSRPLCAASPPHTILTLRAPVRGRNSREPLQSMVICLAGDGRGEEALPVKAER
jgi:hypothetical protein